MDQTQLITQLTEGTFLLQGQFMRGSNYTFLGNIATDNGQMAVVYKPSRGEQPLWDFPVKSLAKREVAAYELSKFLGWDLVPLTIYRKRKLPFGPGSIQLYISHDPTYHYFSFSQTDRASLSQVALFDLIINNADRKGSHVLIDEEHKIWCIDHGICFHVEDKLRTVIWDFANLPLTDPQKSSLQGLLEKSTAITEILLPYLRKSEIRAILRRTTAILKLGVFPFPPKDRRMFPYPPV